MSMLRLCAMTVASLIAFVAIGLCQPASVQVSAMVSGRISDVDDNAVQGIAIVGASDGWRYSINDRQSWQPIDLNSGSLLLNTVAWIQHDRTEAAEGSLSPWLDYRAWDQTEGAVGTHYEITSFGGTSAFSETAGHVVLSMANTACDEDRKLAVGVKALSAGGNIALLSDVQYTITPSGAGTFQPRAATDPVGVAGYFVPSGVLGVATLSVSGKNKRGVQVTPGTITIEVVVGAAQVIVVEDLGEVDQ